MGTPADERVVLGLGFEKNKEGEIPGEYDLPEGRSCFIPGCNHPLVYLGIPLCSMDDGELQDMLVVAQNLLVKAQEMKQAEEEEGAQVTGALRR